jgi:predicted phosphodiesterase
MKIQYMSDLHLEFEGEDNMPVPEVFGDVLVLAGDIGVGINHEDWIKACCGKFKNVIYVLGNHEFYGKNMQKVRAQWADMDMPTNFYFLDNDWITIDDVNFIGSTLWSDVHPACPLNDFYKIGYKYPGGYGKFSQIEAKDLFHRNKIWLKNTLDLLTGQRNVVVTHHAPSWRAQDPKYAGENGVVGSGFSTDILEEFEPRDILVWIYGHLHYNTSFTEHGIYCVSNQRGYVGYGLAEGFDPNMYVEV